MIKMDVQIGANKISETDESIAYLTSMDKVSFKVTTDLPFSIVCADKWKFNDQTFEDDFIGMQVCFTILGTGTFEIDIKPGDSLTFKFWEGLPGIKISEMPKKYIITRD